MAIKKFCPIYRPIALDFGVILSERSEPKDPFHLAVVRALAPVAIPIHYPVKIPSEKCKEILAIFGFFRYNKLNYFYYFDKGFLLCI